MVEAISPGDLIAYQEYSTHWVCGEVVAINDYGIRIRQCDESFTVPIGVDVFIHWYDLPPLLIASPGSERQLTAYIVTQIRLVIGKAKSQQKNSKKVVTDASTKP